MTHSESIKEIATALSKAQTELKNPTKSKTVKVTTKSGGQYSYQYAELSDILDQIKPVLEKNGLAVIQGSHAGTTGMVVETMITHTSGEWIASELELNYESGGRMNSAQEMASAITYGRRYLLSAMLNIAADADDDASHVESQKHQAQNAEPLNGAGTDGLQSKCICGKMMIEKSGTTKAGKPYRALMCPDATMDNKQYHSDPVWL